MAMANCNSCDRKHDRPVNSKCLYFKAALSKCVDLGVSSDDYRFYLPELGVITTNQSEGGLSATPSSAFPLMAEDIMALLQDNADCKKKLAETQLLLGQVMTRLDSMSIGVSQAPLPVPASVAIGGTTTSTVYVSSQGPGSYTQVPLSTSTMTTASSQGAVWSGVGLSSSAPLRPVAPPPGYFWPPATSIGGQPSRLPGARHWAAQGIPPSSLVDQSPSTTVLGTPLLGQRTWLNQLIAGSGLGHPPSPVNAGLYSTSTSVPHSASTTGPSSMGYSAALPSSDVLGLAGWPSTQQAIFQDPSGGPPVNITVDASGIKAATKRRKCVIFDIEPHLYVDSVKSATIDDVISAEMSMLESMLALGLLLTT